ncbi:Uncharacterised protein [Mycobacteroides abscessus subsp. abscessus]|nr:Uncharacterised protein [Mycobacteroides abscessus subsp. abscessus]SKW68310.1 Uncharacterised protein [Mycobacteroides abscessus subsp. abscessus]
MGCTPTARSSSAGPSPDSNSSFALSIAPALRMIRSAVRVRTELPTATCTPVAFPPLHSTRSTRVPEYTARLGRHTALSR